MNIVRIAAVVLLGSTVLGGCGTIRGAGHALNARPVYPHTLSNIDIARASQAHVARLGFALSVQNMPQCDAFTTAENAPPADLEHYGCDAGRDLNLGPDQLEIYLDRSIFLINAYCDGYLDSLATLGDGSRWSRSQFNTVANYIGVLMALAGQPAEDLGYLNAAAGFFNSSADNLETLVLVSPTPGKLTPLVESAQRDKMNGLPAMRQSDRSLRFSNYNRWIQEYAYQCTPRGIRLLLDAAIDNSSDTDSSAKLAASARNLGDVLGAAVLGMTDKESLKTGWPDLKRPENLGALAWLIRSGEQLSAEESAYINEVLGRNLADATRAVLNEAEDGDRLRAFLLNGSEGAYDDLIRSAQADFNAASESEANRKAADAAREEARAARLELEALRQQLNAANERLAAIPSS